MNWSSGWPAFVALAFRSSRSGPTLPFDPAGLKVWQAEQPELANCALPAAALPAAGWVYVGVVVFPGAASAAPFFSRPKTTTALIIAAKKATHSSTYQLRLRPGKLGFLFGRTNEETSAKAMKAAPVRARPTSWPVERAKTIAG